MRENNTITGWVLLISVLLLMLTGCKKKQLSQAEFVQWARTEANGLKKAKSVNGLVFEVQYKPADYVIANEHRGKPIAPDAYAIRKAGLQGMHYFDLRITTEDAESNILMHQVRSRNEIQERIAYFSYWMKDEIRLMIGGRSVPCELYHFERSYDLSNARTFVLGFPRNETGAGDLQLVVNPSQLETGPVKFRFDEETLKQLPKLAI